MKISRWTLRSAVSFVALLGAANGLHAQVSTGGFTGFVTDETGKAMAGAQVQIVNRATGSRAGSLTNDAGRYYVSALETGGPYTITIRRIGFAQRDTNDLYVSLGQTIRVDISLKTAVTRLGERRNHRVDHRRRHVAVAQGRRDDDHRFGDRATPNAESQLHRLRRASRRRCRRRARAFPAAARTIASTRFRSTAPSRTISSA